LASWRKEWIGKVSILTRADTAGGRFSGAVARGFFELEAVFMRKNFAHFFLQAIDCKVFTKSILGPYFSITC
jgi:hypothetical protein